MNVFWNKLDDHMVAMFTVAMGASSSYTSLKAQTVNKRIYADAFEWSRWTLPAIAVACYRIGYVLDGHTGGSKTLYRKTYRFVAHGILGGLVNLEASPIVDTVSEAIKEFYERMELVISTDTFAVSTENFRARKATITEGDADIIRYTEDGIDSNRRLAIATILFDVQAS